MSVDARVKADVVLPSNINDSDLSCFEAEVNSAIESRPSQITVNCGELMRVTSSHVGAIWLAHSMCTEAGISLCLTRVSHKLIRVLESLDVGECIPIDCRPTRGESAEWSSGDTRVGHRSLRLSFLPTVDDIDAAVHDFDQHMAGIGIADSIAVTLKTVFYEIATNIRLHSSLESGCKIILSADFSIDSATLCFSDSGPKFDPTDRVLELDPGEAIRRGQRHGFGLGMIRKLTDLMSYRRTDDGRNELIITKKWSV